MSMGEEQQKEIATIKERYVKLNLSDADCERISKKAGKHGLTVGELLENFIGDLVDGTYSNGSDERDRAEQWFERCWFGMFPEPTLLRYFLEWGMDIEDFLILYDELQYYKENPEEYEKEKAECAKNGEERLWIEEEYHDSIDSFLREQDKDKEKINIENEVKLCRDWLDNKQALKGESE